MVQDHYITLEVCHHLGNFLGALPTGQITDPAQTEKSSEVAQFAPIVIVSVWVFYQVVAAANW